MDNLQESLGLYDIVRKWRWTQSCQNEYAGGVPTTVTTQEEVYDLILHDTRVIIRQIVEGI